MIYEQDIVDRLEDILPNLLQEANLEQIKVYMTDKPYYIEEFPSEETTPILSVYRVKDSPDEVGWIRQLNIDLYVYYDKTKFKDVNRSIDNYERIIVPVIEKDCTHLEIVDITFPTYINTGNFYLKGFQILTEVKDGNII